MKQKNNYHIIILLCCCFLINSNAIYSQSSVFNNMYNYYGDTFNSIWGSNWYNHNSFLISLN